jgi:hypothetical protein
MSIQRSASMWQLHAAGSLTAVRPAVSHCRLCWTIFRDDFARKTTLLRVNSGKFSAVIHNRENHRQDIEKAR